MSLARDQILKKWSRLAIVLGIVGFFATMLFAMPTKGESESPVFYVLLLVVCGFTTILGIAFFATADERIKKGKRACAQEAQQ